MSNAKERLFGAITVMNEKDAVKIWRFVRTHFSFPEVEPTEEEIAVARAYENGDEEYQPYISHDDLKRELGIETKR